MFTAYEWERSYAYTLSVKRILCVRSLSLLNKQVKYLFF
jgi:hypothetical protein